MTNNNKKDKNKIIYIGLKNDQQSQEVKKQFEILKIEHEAILGRHLTDKEFLKVLLKTRTGKDQQ